MEPTDEQKDWDEYFKYSYQKELKREPQNKRNIAELEEILKEPSQYIDFKPYPGETAFIRRQLAEMKGKTPPDYVSYEDRKKKNSKKSAKRKPVKKVVKKCKCK